MPPKRAVGRARRGPRPSPRRKNSQSLPAAEEDFVNENSSPIDSSPTSPSNVAASVTPSSTSTIGIPAREVDGRDCAVSPKKVAPLSLTAREPSKDAVSGGAQTGSEGASEPPDGKDTALQNDVGLPPSSTPKTLGTIDGNPNSESADVKQDLSTSSGAQAKVRADVGAQGGSPSESNAAVGGEESATVTGTSDKDAAEGSGKKKRMVKKTIKVVKKIIKRVPKGSIKAGLQDSNAVVLGSTEGNGNLGVAGPGTSCSNSTEKEVQKLITTTSPSPVPGNPSSVALPAVNLKETQQNTDSPGQPIKNKPDLSAREGSNKKVNVHSEQNSGAVEKKSQVQAVRNVQNLSDSGSVSVCLIPEEKKGEKLETTASCLPAATNSATFASPATKTQGRQKSMDKQNSEAPEGIMEIEQKSSVVTEDLQVQNIKGDDQNIDGADGGVSKEENDVSEAFNEDGSRKRGRTDVQLKPEDEIGDGAHCSGEVEAMERRKRRKTEIFIGGIDRAVKKEDIRRVFGQVGEVVDLRLPMSMSKGKNKGYAFLRYASAVDAKTALEKLSNVEICGKQCYVSAVVGNDTIYVGNIDKDWKDEDVSKLLLGVGIGKIDTISVVKDPSNSGRNRGFAFVEFETCKDAQVALKKLQMNDAFAKFKVAWAEQLEEVDERELLKVKTVYAEFIPMTWDEAKLTEKFEGFGEIEKVVLAKDLLTAKRKDIAFISYKFREAAIACIESLTHKPLSNDETKVDIKVSLALPNQRNKQKKQVTYPSSKGTSKGKSKANPGKLNVKPTDMKRKGLLAIQRYGMHKPEHSTIYGEHRPQQSTIYGERGREQASHWLQARTAPLNIGQPATHSAGTRLVSALDPRLVHSGLNRYSDFRLEASIHNGSREYMNGYPTYGSESSLPFSSRQYDGGYPHHRLDPMISASSRYSAVSQTARPPPSMYSSRDMYASGLPYPAANHPTTEVEDEILRRSSLYRRY